MKTFDMNIRWPHNVNRLAKFLVGASQWFAVEPYPDGYYRVYVKAENESLLRGAVEYIQANKYSL